MRGDEATVSWAHLDHCGADPFEAVLSPDERSRAAAFRFPRDRSRCLGAPGGVLEGPRRGPAPDGHSPDPERWSIVDLGLLYGYPAAVAVEDAAPPRVSARPVSLEAL
ncbi:MAG: hypothetical protein ACXWGV_04115 [Solirubrobacterales bacterium]